MAHPPLPNTLRVLFVEDDAMAQQLVEAILPDAWDYEVAATASQARTVLNNRSYDVALVDIRLEAAEGGLELFEQMKEHGYWKRARAIAVTAYALPGDRERFLEAGFDGCVAKPFTRDQLLDAIAEVVM